LLAKLFSSGMAGEVAEGLLYLNAHAFEETEDLSNELAVLLIKTHLELEGLPLDELLHFLFTHRLPP
jgi:hypothetical protein